MRLERSDRPVPLLTLDHISVSRGGTPVLTDVSCAVRRGEVVAVLGSNGSGKSTMVSAALGLIPVSGGSVRLYGTEPARFRHWHRIGYVPQRSTVGMRGATVRDVVASGRLSRRPPFGWMRASDRAAVQAALEAVNLADRARDELALLSGGQQQRALIARALASEPEMLVLDEPLAGVDLSQQEVLADVLRALVGQGVAMLVVLHETGPLGSLIDRALILENGSVVHDGALPHLGAQHRHRHQPARVGKILRGAIDPEDTLA